MSTEDAETPTLAGAIAEIEKRNGVDHNEWDGLFDSLTPDPVGAMLGTGMLRFESPFGVDGLVRPSKNKLEFLAVVSRNPGHGQFRRLIEQAKARAREVYVWEDWNPLIGEALARYGFTRVRRREDDGEILTGWCWKEAEGRAQ